MRGLLALLVGYVLGSILPAYLIGRARGIDMRVDGSGNAGTLNAYHVLGLWPAVVTGVWDVSKGVIAVALAWGWLGVGETLAYAAGLAAVLGHRHPFYLDFHGARGLSVNVGLGYMCGFIALYRGWLPWQWLLGLTIAYVVMFAAVKVGALAQLVLLPVLWVVVIFHRPGLVFSAFFGIVLVFIWGLHFTALRDMPARAAAHRPSRA